MSNLRDDDPEDEPVATEPDEVGSESSEDEKLVHAPPVPNMFALVLERETMEVQGSAQFSSALIKA